MMFASMLVNTCCSGVQSPVRFAVHGLEPDPVAERLGRRLVAVVGRLADQRLDEWYGTFAGWK